MAAEEEVMLQAQPAPPAAALDEPSASALREAGLRGLDLKVRPPAWDGREAGWQDVRFRLEAIMCQLQLDGLLAAAEAEPGAPLSEAGLAPDQRSASRLLWTVLVQGVAGRPAAILRLHPKGQGFRVWQALVREFEPPSASRYVAQLAGLLAPRFHGDAAFRRS